VTLVAGTFVRHPGQPAWGTGKVIEAISPGKVRVHFAAAGEKVLLLSAAPLEPASPSVVEEQSLAAGPKRKPGPARRPAKPAASPPKAPGKKPLESLISEFLWVFPGGFRSSAYFAQEREPKVKAHELAAWELSEARLRAAVQEGRSEDVEKAALLVLGATGLVSLRDQAALRDGLVRPTAREAFSHRLLDLLHGNAAFQARFEAFAEVLVAAGAATWPVATYFPFILFPREHMFLKPVVTQKAAEACGFALAYDTRLNWRTYEQLLAFAKKVEKYVVDLEPEDLFDVQSFLWVAGGGQKGG
jgi:hypothetical protein